MTSGGVQLSVTYATLVRIIYKPRLVFLSIVTLPVERVQNCSILQKWQIETLHHLCVT